MWQSILFSNNGNILASPFPWRSAMLVQARYCIHCGRQVSAVWTQSGESGNTLKNKCSGTSDERANIFAVPTTTEAECSSRCSVSAQCLTRTKQVFRKDYSVERQPTTLAHSSAKEKAPEVSPRQCVMGLLVRQDRDRGSTAKPPKPDGSAGTPLYILYLIIVQNKLQHSSLLLVN